MKMFQQSRIREKDSQDRGKTSQDRENDENQVALETEKEKDANQKEV